MADESEGAYKAGPFVGNGVERFIERMHGEGLGSKETKFSNHQLPGGELPEEILLTAPNISEEGQDPGAFIANGRRQICRCRLREKHFFDTKDEASVYLLKHRAPAPVPLFPFDEPNILAHVG